MKHISYLLICFCFIVSANVFAELNNSSSLRSNPIEVIKSDNKIINDTRFSCLANCLDKNKDKAGGIPAFMPTCYQACDKSAPYISGEIKATSVLECQQLAKGDCIECVSRYDGHAGHIYKCATKDIKKI